jgi:N-acetyl-anhydromuramyl-L-alanine amidase AmpD
MADYAKAQDHFLPADRFGYHNQNSHAAIVVHKTAGDATPQAVVNTFLATGKSVHYVIGQDGSVWQLIPEADGAGGNCCADDSHDPFWTPYISKYENLNFCTISIEHCDPASDNSTPLTPAQQEASFELIQFLMHKYGITRAAVKGHNTIDRTICPGNYPWQALDQFLQAPPPSTVAVPRALIEELIAVLQKFEKL